MSTLAEIEAAVVALPFPEQKRLLDFLFHRVRNAPRKTRRGLKAAARPALEGLSPALSIGTRDKVRALVAKRHAANR